MKQTSLSIPD